MTKKPKLPIRILVYCILSIILVMINLPFIWMLVTSFKEESDVFAWPPKFYPTIFSFDNFRGAFSLIPMGRLLLNTLFVSLAVTISQLVFNSLAAYGLSRFKFRGRDFIFYLLIGTLMVPGEVIIIPLYIIMRNMGLLHGNTKRTGRCCLNRWSGKIENTMENNSSPFKTCSIYQRPVYISRKVECLSMAFSGNQ